MHQQQQHQRQQLRRNCHNVWYRLRPEHLQHHHVNNDTTSSTAATMGTTLTATGLPQYQQAPTKDSDLRTKLRSLWGPICLLSSLNTYRKHRYTTDHHGCHTPTANSTTFFLSALGTTSLAKPPWAMATAP